MIYMLLRMLGRRIDDPACLDERFLCMYVYTYVCNPCIMIYMLLRILRTADEWPCLSCKMFLCIYVGIYVCNDIHATKDALNGGWMTLRVSMRDFYVCMYVRKSCIMIYMHATKDALDGGWMALRVLMRDFYLPLRLRRAFLLVLLFPGGTCQYMYVCMCTCTYVWHMQASWPQVTNN